MTEEFFKLTKCFMRDPVTILVKNEELTLEGIKQFYIEQKSQITNLLHYVIFMKRVRLIKL